MDVYPAVMQEEVCSPMGAWLGNLNLVMEGVSEVFKLVCQPPGEIL